MEEFLDDNLLSIVTSLQLFFSKYYTNFISIGQAIGGTMCLVIVAQEAYQMMQLKKGIDVLALLRPILLSLVLANWTSFTMALRQPFVGEGNSVEGWAKNGIYKREKLAVDQLHEQRWKIQLSQYTVLQDARAKADAADEAMQEDKSLIGEIYGTVEDFFEKVVDLTKTRLNMKNTFFAWIFEKLIDFIAMLIWNCCVLLTFFAREIGLGIMTITGPITFGMSVLPVWKDAWASWVSRYISLCLYGFVAYVVMAAALQLFKYGIEVDIKRMSTPGIVFTDFMNFNGLYVLMGAVVGGFGLRMVPEIVTWIVPANSGMAISHFVGGVMGAGQKAVATAGKAVAATV